VTVERDTKLMKQWVTTAVSVHDIRILENWLVRRKPTGNLQFWVDCVYRSKEMVERLRNTGISIGWVIRRSVVRIWRRVK